MWKPLAAMDGDFGEGLWYEIKIIAAKMRSAYSNEGKARRV
jgi:hypothetical protein